MLNIDGLLNLQNLKEKKKLKQKMKINKIPIRIFCGGLELLNKCVGLFIWVSGEWLIGGLDEDSVELAGCWWYPGWEGWMAGLKIKFHKQIDDCVILG